MTDSKVEKLADYWQDPRCEARHFIREFEAAGLLVIDADDPATVERVAHLLSTRWARPWDQITIAERSGHIADARAVLAALAMPRDGAQSSPA